MHKSLIYAGLTLIAIAVLSLPLPAIAQAVNHPVLTHPTGTIPKPGLKITWVSVGNLIWVNTTAGEEAVLTCSIAHETSVLTSNTTGNVASEITSASYTGTGAGGACTGFASATVTPLGLPYCIKSTEVMSTDEWTTSAGKCSEAQKKVRYLLKPNVGGECEFEATTTTSMRGTFTTDSPEDASTIDALMHTPRTGHTSNEDAGFRKVRDTTVFSLCPSSIALRVSFTLTTDEHPSEPLYFST